MHTCVHINTGRHKKRKQQRNRVTDIIYERITHIKHYYHQLDPGKPLIFQEFKGSSCLLIIQRTDKPVVLAFN